MPAYTHYPDAFAEIDLGALCQMGETAQALFEEGGIAGFEFAPWVIDFTPAEGNVLVDEMGNILTDESGDHITW